MKQTYQLLESTLSKSSILDFKAFVDRFQDVTKWFMCSDYCLDDFNKPNDVITFVVYPYIVDFSQWMNLISHLQKTDLKHCRRVSSEFCSFSHDGYFFCFNFIISKDAFINDWRNEERLKENLEVWIDMINKKWKISSPHNITYYEELESRLKKLEINMRRKNFNYKLLSRIMAVTFLSSYIRYLLIRETNRVESFSWLPDRDKMTSFCKSIYEVIYKITAESLCMNFLREEKYSKIKEAIVADIEKNMFYDELNRVADFMCGGIADINLETGEVSKQKHRTLIREAIAENPNIVTVHIGKRNISKIIMRKSSVALG